MSPGECLAFMVGVEGFYQQSGASAQALDGIVAVKAAIRSGEKTALALNELEGFAKRNVERAKKAHEAAQTPIPNDGSEESERALEARIEAGARFHEAQRFYDVVRMRVKEALDP